MTKASIVEMSEKDRFNFMHLASINAASIVSDSIEKTLQQQLSLNRVHNDSLYYNNHQLNSIVSSGSDDSTDSNVDGDEDLRIVEEEITNMKLSPLLETKQKLQENRRSTIKRSVESKKKSSQLPTRTQSQAKKEVQRTKQQQYEEAQETLKNLIQLSNGSANSKAIFSLKSRYKSHHID